MSKREEAVQKELNTNRKRYFIIDQIRGIAIVLMVFFHLFFDLNMFGALTINFSKNPFWYFLPRLIVFLFLIAVGLSLSVVHEEQIKWKKFLPRLYKIIALSICISIITWLLFPRTWVYFGTLHCIALCSLMALPILKFPKVALFISLALIIPSAFFDKNLPWFTLPHASMDYISPFPWFGAVCLGLFLKTKGFHKIHLGHGKILSALSILGRHSLKIYVLHQPILYGALYIFFNVIKV